MRLFKALSILILLFSSNLFAGGAVENESDHPPRILRGVRVRGAKHVDIKGDVITKRVVDGQFGIVSSSMDWSIYRFERPYGVFWTKEVTEAYKTLKTAGIVVDIDPERDGFSLLEENLKSITVNAGNYEIPLWDAILKYSIDNDGILVITQ